MLQLISTGYRVVVFRRIFSGVLATVLFTVLFAATFAQARELPPAAPGEFIIKYSDEAIESLRDSSVELKRYTISQIREALGRVLGSDSQEELSLIKARVLKLQGEQDLDLEFLADLFDTGLVDYIEPNYIVSIDATPNDSFLSSLWGLHNTGQSGGTADIDIDAPEAWELNTGSNEIVVGVVDTGVDFTHTDLASNMWTNSAEASGTIGVDDDGNGVVDDVYGFNAIDDSGNPMDDHSHGTHCAGTIGATGNNGNGVVGVNWNVKIMALKFLDSEGSGFTSDAIQAIEYAVNMKSRGVNIRVLNNSWGGGSYQQALRDAIIAAKLSGILFVAAAGNEASDNDSEPAYPANYEEDNVISVAAIDRNGNLASFSNFGSNTVDVAAPGVFILSTVVGGGYGSMSGTSMAAPHVSGLAALILSNTPSLNTTELRAVIRNSAQSLSSLQGKVNTGAMINAFAALSGDINIPPEVDAISDLTIDKAGVEIGVSASDVDGDSLLYSAEVDSADSAAYSLDTSLGLWTNGEYYYNSWGYQEKWIRDESGKWYFIKPRGNLYRFDNIDSVPLVASLSSDYYSNPESLCDADQLYLPPAELTFNGNRLTISPRSDFLGSFDVNVSVSDGRVSVNRQFSVLVIGNAAPVIVSLDDLVVLAEVPICVNIEAFDADGDSMSFEAHVNSDAETTPADVSISGNVLSVDVREAFLGSFAVVVEVSDGTQTVEDSFSVRILSSDDDEAELIDSDGDGVADYQELQDGTDLFDSGSYRVRLTNYTHALWNGFLGMENILEMVNIGLDEARVKVSLFDVNGLLASEENVKIQPQSQVDLILNEMLGFQSNSYGIVKLEFSGDIDGRLSFYRRETLGEFAFAFGVPFANSLYGKTSVAFNTFQPSVNPAEMVDVVENWLSVVNLSSETKRYTVVSYNQQGDVLDNTSFKVRSFERVDLDGGHGFAGAGVVGMNEIIPADDTAPYIAQLVRYGGNGKSGVAASKYSFAFPLAARAGNGRPIHMPISRMFGGDNWVEVANTLNVRELIEVSFRNSAGEEVVNERMWLDPHAQVHFSAAAYLSEGESGVVTVTSQSLNSIVSQSMFYFRNAETGSVDAMYGTQAQEAAATSIYGSFNLYLGMENWLRLCNTSSDAQEVSVVVSGPSGIAESLVTLSAYSSMDIPIHDNGVFQTEPNTYGSIGVTSSNGNALISELIRVRPFASTLDFAMPTTVR